MGEHGLFTWNGDVSIVFGGVRNEAAHKRRSCATRLFTEKIFMFIFILTFYFERSKKKESYAEGLDDLQALSACDTCFLRFSRASFGQRLKRARDKNRMPLMRAIWHEYTAPISVVQVVQRITDVSNYLSAHFYITRMLLKSHLTNSFVFS